MVEKKKVTMSQGEFPHYVADQLSAVWLEISRARGRDRAFRHVLQALASTHPDPVAVKGLLDKTVPELVDAVTDDVENNAALEAAMDSMSEELGSIREIVEFRAADATPDDD